MKQDRAQATVARRSFLSRIVAGAGTLGAIWRECHARQALPKELALQPAGV